MDIYVLLHSVHENDISININFHRATSRNTKFDNDCDLEYLCVWRISCIHAVSEFIISWILMGFFLPINIMIQDMVNSESNNDCDVIFMFKMW